MKIHTLITIAILALTPAIAGNSSKRITIHGEWDVENPPHLITDAELRADRSYLVTNNTTETISILQIEIAWDNISQSWGRLARGYANIGAGLTWQMETPPYLTTETYTLDFYLRGLEGTKNLNGKNGIVITEQPEIETGRGRIEGN